MAICLRKQFASCGSFAFVGRRNHQTSCFDQKTSKASPVLKEISSCDYSSRTGPRNYQALRMRTNVERYPNNLARISDTNPVCHSKYNESDYCSVMKPNSLMPEDGLMYCVSKCRATESNSDPCENDRGRASEAQLERVSKTLSEDLPKLFVKSMDFRIYHQDLIFENNIRGTKSRGLVSYISEIAILKIIGHLKFAQVRLKVLKLTTHPEDGTVRVRWRIVGISNYSAFFQFWKYSPGRDDTAESWYDGFSIFYVRSDGLVHKHTVDKMMPDSEGKVEDVKSNLAAKMAFAVGLILKDFSTNPLYLKRIQKEHPEISLLLKESHF